MTHEMTHEELEAYINNFHEVHRDTVYKEIIDSELLAKVFSMPEGKLILNSAVDLISADIMKITAACVKEDFDYTKIVPLAYEINTTYKLMTEWARVLIKGDEHKQKATKTK